MLNSKRYFLIDPILASYVAVSGGGVLEQYLQTLPLPVVGKTSKGYRNYIWLLTYAMKIITFGASCEDLLDHFPHSINTGRVLSLIYKRTGHQLPSRGVMSRVGV